jgi:hypothetical protein
MASLTWKDLAAELGVSAFSLHRWRHLEGAPANPDLKDRQDFKAQRGLGRDRAAPELAALKAELLRAQIKRERARNSREAGRFVERTVVEEMLSILDQKLDLLLRLKLEVELGPRVAGKSALEANVEGGAILDEIRELVNGNIANFRSDVELPSSQP